jgi:hypothetical protein
MWMFSFCKGEHDAKKYGAFKFPATTAKFTIDVAAQAAA